MLALSPPLFSTLLWPFDEPISHEHNNIYGETETSDSFLPSSSSQPQAGLLDSTPSVATLGTDATTMVKKLNHNASERDRRKKINSLYSSLRSLLPAADQTKKLSIPVTVSRVLKYVPELQKEVEKLVQKKEELVSRISRQEELVQYSGKEREVAIQNSLSSVSASLVGDREVLIQISTLGINKGLLLSEALMSLEEDGLLLLHASNFESFVERVFYNLHLQVQGTQNIEIEMIREKLLSLYEKRIRCLP
ncbi:unnamed protein product [Ilex paraguariensis]|uniref:BHLH domain-containing protein n=1 Tax=Ilex paraguariensis TaxID=185542 RepID=A0ABC8V5D7_9AQUA